MVNYFGPLSNDRKLHVRDKFLAVRYLNIATDQGLLDVFKRAVESVGIEIGTPRWWDLDAMVQIPIYM